MPILHGVSDNYLSNQDLLTLNVNYQRFANWEQMNERKQHLSRNILASESSSNELLQQR